MALRLATCGWQPPEMANSNALSDASFIPGIFAHYYNYTVRIGSIDCFFKKIAISPQQHGWVVIHRKRPHLGSVVFSIHLPLRMF